MKARRRPSYISAASRLHLGCISTASRPHLGCISAASRLQALADGEKTVELRFADGTWCIGQFKLKKNARPPQEARALAQRWLERVTWNP